MVEAPAPWSGRVNEQPVEHFPAGIVGVETLVQEMTQETPALRDAGADGRRDRKLRPGIVAGPGDDVAHGGQAHPDDDRIPRAVDEIVDLPGQKAAGEKDVRRGVHEATFV